MTSALFSYNGSTAQAAHQVAYSTTYNVALVSGDGVASVEWTIFGRSHEVATDPTITVTGDLTATITIPTNPGADRAWGLLCVVNRGRGINNKKDAALRCSRVFGTRIYQDTIPLVCGETFERGPIVGWTEAANALLRSRLMSTSTGVSVAGTLDVVNALGIASTAGFRLDETIYEENCFSSNQFMDGFAAVQSGTGAGLIQGSVSVIEHDGLNYANTGTTATGYSYLQQSAFTQFRCGHGEIIAAFVVRTDTVLSNSTDTYTIVLGLLEGTGSHAVVLTYTHGVNSGAWTFTTTAGGTSTSVSTGVTVAVSTIYRIAITINATRTAAAVFINGVLAVTPVATNIPASNPPLGLAARITKSAGTTNRVLMISKIKGRIQNTYESLV